MAAIRGIAYAAAGKFEESREILEELKAKSQKQYVSPLWIGNLYGALGDIDKYFELANKACEERSEALLGIKGDPNLVPYQSDPRYQALLKKMGLE